jgi:hypothetical protein
MKVWWLAIDKNGKHCSYLELKHRKVIAQGWSALGDLTSLKTFYFGSNKKGFKETIQLLGDTTYKGKHWFDKNRKLNKCPSVMWNMMDIKKGDLIIGIEGTTIKGICEISVDGIKSYNYDDRYEYAQTIGKFVEWIDWDKSLFGFTPSTPRQGVHGIKHLNKKSSVIIAAWKTYKKID